MGNQLDGWVCPKCHIGIAPGKSSCPTCVGNLKIDQVIHPTDNTKARLKAGEHCCDALHCVHANWVHEGTCTCLYDCYCRRVGGTCPEIDPLKGM